MKFQVLTEESRRSLFLGGSVSPATAKPTREPDVGASREPREHELSLDMLLKRSRCVARDASNKELDGVLFYLGTARSPAGTAPSRCREAQEKVSKQDGIAACFHHRALDACDKDVFFSFALKHHRDTKGNLTSASSRCGCLLYGPTFVLSYVDHGEMCRDSVAVLYLIKRNKVAICVWTQKH